MEDIVNKAKELVGKYVKFKRDGRFHVFGLELSKQFALIAVDEVIKALEEHQWQNRNTIEDYKQMRLEVEKL